MVNKELSELTFMSVFKYYESNLKNTEKFNET